MDNKQTEDYLYAQFVKSLPIDEAQHLVVETIKNIAIKAIAYGMKVGIEESQDAFTAHIRAGSYDPDEFDD